MKQEYNIHCSAGEREAIRLALEEWLSKELIYLECATAVMKDHAHAVLSRLNNENFKEHEEECAYSLNG